MARIEVMTARLRVFACAMVLAATLAPWAVFLGTAVHLALDAHHADAGDASGHDHHHDPDNVLHGHGHDDATQVHRHDARLTLVSGQIPGAGLASHPSVAAFAVSAPAVSAAFQDRAGPRSPPPRIPVILRI